MGLLGQCGNFLRRKKKVSKCKGEAIECFCIDTECSTSSLQGKTDSLNFQGEGEKKKREIASPSIGLSVMLIRKRVKAGGKEINGCFLPSFPC